MSKRLLTAAAAVAVLAAFAQTATAAPTPDYTVTCAVGGQTGVTWSHAKLSSVTFAWTTSGGLVTNTVPGLSPHPPHGSILTATAGGATSVTVTFHEASGVDDPVTEGCL
jgi:hypothetical protein